MRRGDEEGKMEEEKREEKREEKLISLLPESQTALIKPLIHTLINLEAEIEKLEKIPHIRINKQNGAQQLLPAGKLYKEKVNLYLNVLNLILKTTKQTAQESTTDPFIQAITFRGDEK